MTTERKLMYLKCILKHDTVQRGQKKIGKCMQENREAMRNKKKKNIQEISIWGDGEEESNKLDRYKKINALRAFIQSPLTDWKADVLMSPVESLWYSHLSPQNTVGLSIKTTASSENWQFLLSGDKDLGCL